MNTPKPSLKRRALWSLELGLEWLGMTRLYSDGRPGGAVILMYHSVTTDETARFVDPRVQVDVKSFAEQMRLIAECRTPIGISDLVDGMSRRVVPHRGVVVTFDDGYLDTLTVAAPILEAHKIPAMLYVPTDYVERRATQWVDRLHHAFVQRTRDRLSVDGCAYDLRDVPVASCLRSKLEQRLLLAAMDGREALLTSIEEQLVPSIRQPRLTIGWDELRALRRRHPRFELGIHTAEHTDMTSKPVSERRDELVRALSAARSELGANLRHFSYPYSRDDDDTRVLLRSLGFESAVTAGDDIVVHGGDDPMRMSRLEPHDNVAMLRYWTSGAHPALPRMMFGHA